MSKEIAEEYASSLADLTVNSKPLINMLTILAEENIDHAGVIVETVEKHLEKVQPEIKLPVLYLVDSIIKNVGGAYTQKFSQSIVNMFTRTFKQVDEKVRSQMFKLRETWHDVFPATKLYQLDVKVNLIDPAWPIQAQPHQSNIHVNPNFLKKTTASNAAPQAAAEEDEKMRNILAKKEQELLMLQRKKIEMELEQTKRQLEMAEKSVKRGIIPEVPVAPPAAMPVALLSPVVAPAELPNIPVKQRLGPPVNKVGGGRIAPVSAALASARRDPRLARRPPPAPAPAPALGPAPPAPAPAAPIAPNVFDIKPLARVTKRKNVITIDVRPDRRDPRLDKRRDRPRPKRPDVERKPADRPLDGPLDTDYIDKIIPDSKKINKLPPIPKINRAERNGIPAPAKKRKEARDKKKRRDDPSPEKKVKTKESKEVREEARRRREADAECALDVAELAPVAFKELKNYHKERYMRRNRDHSDSPETSRAPLEPPNVPEVVLSENKDVDLRVLHAGADAAPVAHKRPSTEAPEGKTKKPKVDKFDILFGNEDVDLRQLPQVDEVSAPPPPSISESPKVHENEENHEDVEMSPHGSPKKDWTEVKDKDKEKEVKKTPSKLELVRAKLAEATKGKDRLGRPLLFCKSPSLEKERRQTHSSEDTDLRAENPEDFDATDHKKTISIIMSQAKEQYNDGTLNKDQYNTLMYQVLQLNEKLKLKEAKQRESLEMSKRKLKAHTDENHKVASPKSSPNERNTFGDIDERITPAVYMDTPPDSQNSLHDSDMRMEKIDGPMVKGPPPMPPMMMYGPYQPVWRGPRPRNEEYMPRRFRGPGPFFRAKFDKRGMRPPFEPRMPLLPTPMIGMSQGECPLQPYERCESPPPLGLVSYSIPPTDYKILEYIDQDPVKTIQIDGIPREIRFYGETAVIMLDWDDPREIKFLPGCRRVTFDNKDSVVLSFNEGYKQIEIDDQTFDIRFGAPTRELYINDRWYECFFGGQPLGVIIDGKPRLLHLEGPLPQVNIGKVKRTDLVAGKINLIVNATQMCPVYLDAKVQKFMINGQFFTIRFADALRTVLINEQPFKVEFGDLPKPIYIGNEKYFVRFSALPRNIKPGYVHIANMEGVGIPGAVNNVQDTKESNAMELDQAPIDRPIKTPSPEMNTEHQGLNMLASVMPSNMNPDMTPASGSEYSVAEPLFMKPENIPGLEAVPEDKPALPLLGNINVNDLFAKLVATGIVQVPNVTNNETKSEPKVEEKPKPIEIKNVIHRVDFLKSDTMKVKQPALVARLYGGMQCSGCGARFPPEHTVRYSQHLDWHFRQNRRERDSARRAHSRHWHYDLADWLQYEELEDLDEREKSWFETGGTAGEAPAGAAAGAAGGAAGAGAGAEAPSVAAGAPAAHCCALCGDPFLQFYNEDKEEWHLRNSVRHEDDNYHPLCFEDYKASLAKEEPPKEESTEDVAEVEKIEEAIEIRDVDDTLDQSDNESVVEVVEPDLKESDPVEIDEEGEEDDVVLKAEPVEQVVVEEADTDDETATERAERDRCAEIDFSHVRVKLEPLDPDDEPIITAEEESVVRSAEAAHPSVLSSIDGNTQLDAAPPAAAPPPGGIRINISKALPTFLTNNQEDKMLEDISADDEPLPPGEEPELEYKLKPALEGVQLSRHPPLVRGSELSGLCSIM